MHEQIVEVLDVSGEKAHDVALSALGGLAARRDFNDLGLLDLEPTTDQRVAS
jgi:hypothetical protein